MKRALNILRTSQTKRLANPRKAFTIAAITITVITLTGCNSLADKFTREVSKKNPACTNNPFRCEIGFGAREGYYFVNSKDTVAPAYAIVVEDGSVVSDLSEDEFGCMGRGCDSQMYSLAGNNRYELLDSMQVLRLTPDGATHVLTWHKPLESSVLAESSRPATRVIWEGEMNGDYFCKLDTGTIKHKGHGGPCKDYIGVCTHEDGYRVNCSDCFPGGNCR